jgi:hypothetical protein
MPTGDSAEVTRRWAVAYSSYARLATAGGTVPTVPSPLGVPGSFFEALQASLLAMWTVTPWLGPGLVGTTTLVPPLAPLLQTAGKALIKSRDPQQALSSIANALHTYTLGIAVTVVTPAGVSSVVPVI